MSRLGHALTELGDVAEDGPRVHAIFVYNSNAVAVAPNQNAVRKGFERDDLFTVVHEQFLTDTTDYADYILPATTFLEHDDVQGAYGHYFVQRSHRAIEPLGEARSNVWLFSQLAQRMGFTESCFRDTPEEMIEQALNPDESGHSRNPGMEHITSESLAEEGHIPLAFTSSDEDEAFLPFSSASQGPLPTPSGKIEFYSEVLAAAGAGSAARICAASRVTAGTGCRAIPTGVFAAQGGQLHELDFRQSGWASGHGSADESPA